MGKQGKHTHTHTHIPNLKAKWIHVVLIPDALSSTGNSQGLLEWHKGHPMVRVRKLPGRGVCLLESKEKKTWKRINVLVRGRR